MTFPMTDEVPITDEALDDACGIYHPDKGGPPPDWAHPDAYPRMFNLSAASLFGERMIKAQAPTPAEYVILPMPSRGFGELDVEVSKWNSLWEMAQFRRRAFDYAKLPPVMAKVADLGDNNIIFVPRTRSRYHEYAPLYHLLPLSTVTRFGMPVIRAGSWPFTVDMRESNAAPADFAGRLSAAWAAHIWRHLSPGSPQRGFTKDDPVRLLCHNLDFWVPPVTEMIQEILRLNPEVAGDTIEPEPIRLTDGSILEGAVQGRTLKGGEIWHGEQDAAEMTEWAVELADTTGQLRGILDAVRSNRVEDDFSDHWTFAREDFERKLHRKRSKIKTTFVELTDNIAVQGPETEVVGQTVTGDFMALLDSTNRRIVVLLSSGHTKLTEIASILGYANHSAVSKRLQFIRREVERFLA